MLVCIDNHILIWGIREEATPGQEDMIRRTKLLLDLLEKKKAQVVVPSVVAGEFLLGVPLENHQKVMGVLEKNFQIAPYDTAAALIAAGLWIEKNKGSSGISEELKEGLQDPSRIKLKDDCKIVATAMLGDVRAERALPMQFLHERPLIVGQRCPWVSAELSNKDAKFCIFPHPMAYVYINITNGKKNHRARIRR